MKKIKNILALTIDTYTTEKLFSKNYPSLIFKKKIFPRNDGNKGLIELKKKLKKNNYKVFLKKNSKNLTFDYEMHFYSNIKGTMSDNLLLILPEHPYIDKNCDQKIISKKYKIIFTNIKKFVDNKKFFYINWPLYLNTNKMIKNKLNFSCIIASNKNLLKNVDNSGYAKRCEIIKWFKNHNKGKMHVYGLGWDRPIFSNYYLSRITNFIFNRLNLSLNLLGEDYRGITMNKIQTASKYKFVFCIENVFNERGYNTGQIFDAMIASSVPIYLGRPDISSLVPKNCFIDFNKFKNLKKLCNYLENMDDKTYLTYQKNIFKFCNKKVVNEISEKKFSDTIISKLLSYEK